MIAFLTSRITGYVGIMASVILALVLVQSWGELRSRARTIDGLRLELANTKSDKSSLERDVLGLRGSIDEQNRSIQDQKARAEAAEARADMALASLRAATRRATVLAAEIAARMPAPGVDVCVAAFAEARNPNG